MGFTDTLKLTMRCFLPRPLSGRDTYGAKWVVLCEEITKALTHILESYKGVD